MKKDFLLNVIILLLTACEKNNVNGPQNGDINYKHEMRNFVKGISEYAKSINNDFLIVPQLGK
jgi:cysteinyl-tRNA synthetase